MLGGGLSIRCRQWYWNLWCSADETMNTRPFWFDWNWEVWYFEERKKLHLLVALNPDAIRSARRPLSTNTMDCCAPLPNPKNRPLSNSDRNSKSVGRWFHSWQIWQLVTCSSIWDRFNGSYNAAAIWRLALTEPDFCKKQLTIKRIRTLDIHSPDSQYPRRE